MSSSVVVIGAFRVKVDEYTSKIGNSAVVIFVSLQNGGQLLKERICSHKSRPHFGRFHCPGRQKLFPFVKTVEKHGSVSIHLNPIALRTAKTP